MVTDSAAFFCDAGVLAIISTIITVCYLLIKLFTWFTDSFNAVPDPAKRSQITTMSDRDTDSETTTLRNQGNTEGQSANNRHQTITVNHGLRVREQ